MVRCGFALLVVNAAIAHAADSAPRFEKDVAPIFERYCFQCHGEAVKMGKLDIRSLDAMLTGGSKGPALVKGSADKSLLYQRIADQSMPVGDRKLTAAEAVTVRDWINAGARSDAWSAALDPPKRANTHWAFHPPKRPTIPDVSHRAWVRTPVDAFILNQMERKGIQPAPAADRRTLIRRAYLTLLGLPPKPEEVRAFLQDRSPNVFDKLWMPALQPVSKSRFCAESLTIRGICSR